MHLFSRDPEGHLNATRLIMWQPLEGEDAPATDLEIMDHIFRIDELFESCIFEETHLRRLKAILAKSPWKGDAEFVRFCRETRKDYGYGQERFWWYAELWRSS